MRIKKEISKSIDTLESRIQFPRTKYNLTPREHDTLFRLLHKIKNSSLFQSRGRPYNDAILSVMRDATLGLRILIFDSAVKRDGKISLKLCKDVGTFYSVWDFNRPISGETERDLGMRLKDQWRNVYAHKLAPGEIPIHYPNKKLPRYTA